MIKKTSRSIQSLERAFAIIDLFQDGTCQELSLKEICGRVGLHASTAHHLIATMVQRGYMAQDPNTRHYMLGPAIIRLRAAALDNLDLRRIAHPIMRDLMEQTREETYLTILRGWHTLVLMNFNSPQPVRVVRPHGPEPSLHATASGKVLLAHSDAEFVERYLREVELTAFTPNTKTQPAEIHAELARVRASGLALDREEHVIGVGCIAAPVFDASGKVTAALSISYPVFRAEPNTLAQWQRDVAHSAALLSEQLGHYRSTAQAADIQADIHTDSHPS